MSEDSKGQNEEPKPSGQPHKSEGAWWLFGQKDRVAGFTGWVAIFTGILTTFAGLQLWAFVQSERAFAALDYLQLTGGLVTEKPLELVIRIKNSGKSTAFVEDLMINSRFEKRGNSLPSKPTYLPSNAITPGPILSNGIITVRSTVNELILKEADIAAIKAHDYKFYIYGYISFTDDFTLLWAKRTGFCALYNPDITNQFDACPEREYTYAR